MAVRMVGRLGLVAVVTGAAIASLWLWSGRETRLKSTETAPATRESDEAARLTEERDRLRGQVRRLGVELAEARAGSPSGTVTPTAPAPAPGADPLPERPTPAQEMEWLMARARFLDDALQKQPRDDRWAAPMEAKARTLAESRAGAGVKLESVSCRSTACRMEFSYPDAQARVRHIESVGEDFTELPRVSYAYPGEPEVHTRAIMYLATAAQPLPTLDYKTFAATRAP